MENCVFCKIIKGEIPSEFVYRDEEVVAFRDIDPKASVHILIVPVKHFLNINEAGEVDQPLLGKMMLIAKSIAKEQGVSESGYRLVVNNGPDADQAVGHLHLHLLGGEKLHKSSQASL